MKTYIKIDSETGAVLKLGSRIKVSGEWVDVTDDNRPEGFLEVVDNRPAHVDGKIARLTGYTLSGDHYVAQYSQVNIGQCSAGDIALAIENADLSRMTDFQKTELLKTLARLGICIVNGN